MALLPRTSSHLVRRFEGLPVHILPPKGGREERCPVLPPPAGTHHLPGLVLGAEPPPGPLQLRSGFALSPGLSLSSLGSVRTEQGVASPGVTGQSHRHPDVAAHVAASNMPRRASLGGQGGAQVGSGAGLGWWGPWQGGTPVSPGLQLTSSEAASA